MAEEFDLRDALVSEYRIDPTRGISRAVEWQAITAGRTTTVATCMQYARVAELVDAPLSESDGKPCGFESLRAHQIESPDGGIGRRTGFKSQRYGVPVRVRLRAPLDSPRLI